jgi:hypothetical protein
MVVLCGETRAALDTTATLLKFPLLMPIVHVAVILLVEKLSFGYSLESPNLKVVMGIVLILHAHLASSCFILIVPFYYFFLMYLLFMLIYCYVKLGV